MTAEAKKILVVDDEQEILDLIGAAFNGKNVEAELLTNSQMAESRISRQKYDAIITDIRMGQLDGPTLIQCIRKSQVNKRTPVFVISGVIDKALLLRLQSLGIQGVLVKPFRNAELVSRIMARFEEFDKGMTALQ